MTNVFVSAFRTYGIPDGLLYLLNRLSARMLGGTVNLVRYRFLALPTDVNIPTPRRLGRTVETRMLSLKEVTALAVPRPIDIIRARYRQGSCCLGAFRDRQFVGFIWLQDCSYAEDEVRCRYVLPNKHTCVWDYDLFISPAYRDTAAFLKIWVDALCYLRASGKLWCFSRVSTLAPDSLRAHLRMGAKLVGSAVFISVFKAQILLSTCAPYVHISCRAANIPDLVLPDAKH